MMVGMGRLVSVGTAPVLLLLSCLDTGGCVNMNVVRRESLFNPSRFVWKDSHFSLPPVNKSLILWFNEAEQKLLALDWPHSLIRLPKGESFSGYLYFRDTIPGVLALKFLPHLLQNPDTVFLKGNKSDYCVAIDIDLAMLRSVPGYDPENLVSPCIICNSWSCPGWKQPCRCSWVPIGMDPTKARQLYKRPSVGVHWWNVGDRKSNLVKKPKASGIQKLLTGVDSVKEAEHPQHPNLSNTNRKNRD